MSKYTASSIPSLNLLPNARLSRTPLIRIKQHSSDKLPGFPYFYNPSKSYEEVKSYISPEEGDFYMTPEGYKVFTAQYHLKRGYCCESGCRHCPFGYDPATNSIRP